ncbi:glycosyltransferase family 2 protein [Campylobacter lari]|uniref:glycosyltransferase family 2 protein n=1 Tax=Campylobacter lari TaxID=201 RepID=UPI0021F69F20|nr:glycosyltransferase family 2 protein [Campylobacter lari]EIY6495412.1 glycosyltransferase family 2 protein [Campylobacter lari]MCW0205431.1 glycosyltransferase family 2 protein [Campylobacter lari]HEG5920451.1 glycosyltransferase family 2 protein [Campylobacter lari]
MIIIFPMAGLSSRFLKAGYTKPKYMLQIKGYSVFYNAVIGFKNYFDSCKFLFIYRDVCDTYKFLKTECDKLKIKSYDMIKLENITMGQAHTVMLGLEKAKIHDEENMLIFNIDTFRYNYVLPNFDYHTLDGYLEVFKADGDQWSFIEAGENNKVLKTAEKKRISNLCSSGLYYFKRVKDFKDIFYMIRKNNILVKNEFYIAPMYNYLIQKGKVIKYNEIDLSDIKFCGTPKEYERLKND